MYNESEYILHYVNFCHANEMELPRWIVLHLLA
jgi:hypothetical protein